MNVLVVDDDRASRLVLTDRVRRLGHDVVSAGDGAEALASLESRDISILISDVVMPNLNGFDLCARVRERQADPYVYIILVTALDDRRSYLEGMASGADDLIMKPFDVEHLRTRLGVAERILGLLGRVRELESILSICSTCRRIRERGEQGEKWVSIEAFFERRTQTVFSHALCPECFDEAMMEVE